MVFIKKNKLNEKYNKYKIHNGDIIKIGRIITRIKEIKFADKNFNTKSLYSDNETNSINKSN